MRVPLSAVKRQKVRVPGKTEHNGGTWSVPDQNPARLAAYSVRVPACAIRLDGMCACPIGDCPSGRGRAALMRCNNSNLVRVSKRTLLRQAHYATFINASDPAVAFLRRNRSAYRCLGSVPVVQEMISDESPCHEQNSYCSLLAIDFTFWMCAASFI